MTDAAAGAFLDSVAAGSSEPHDIARRLRSPETGDPEVADHLKWPFDFDLPPVREDRIIDDSPFVPMFSGGGKQYPPAPADMDRGVLDEWTALLDYISHPFLVARYSDFLWITRHGDNPHLHAKRAIDSYVETAALILPTSDEPAEATTMMASVASLQRASELTRETNDRERTTVLAETILEHLEIRNQRPDTGPGVTFGLIDAHEMLSTDERDTRVNETIQLLADTTDDDWMFELATERLAAQAPDAAARVALGVKIVERWIEKGDTSEDLSRIHFYEQAAQAAQRYGLPDLRDAAVARLEQRPPRREEFTTITASAEVDAAAFDERVVHLTLGTSWTDGLPSILSSGPLQGDTASLESEVAAERRSVSAVFPVSVTGPHGALIKVIPSGEAGFDDALIQRHALAINTNSLLVAAALEQLKSTYGVPTSTDIEPVFDSSVTREIAEPAARAVVHHAEGRYDEAVHILYPRIEQAIRNIARMSGLNVTELPRGSRAGGFKPLGAILHEMMASVEKGSEFSGWLVYLTTGLVEPLGVNLRNNYAHALAGSPGTEKHSALLIHIAVFLTAVYLQPIGADGDTPEPQSGDGG